MVFRRIVFSGMSKPASKCVFCGSQRDLTKSHVWPEWIEKILPQSATHHEQIVGQFYTFVPEVEGPAFWKKIKQGHVGTRKPRNTCKECNGGWMRRMEEATMSIMPPLLLGHPYLLETFKQRLLASFLCLISMRVDLSSYKMRAIPSADRGLLIRYFAPPESWKIWIARYDGSLLIDQRYTAMQIASSPDVPRGVEHCNSQVTTLVIGQLCAHLFSSSVWPDFPGYRGAELASIWPPQPFDIDTSDLPIITEADVPWLHETIARTSLEELATNDGQAGGLNSRERLSYIPQNRQQRDPWLLPAHCTRAGHL
jgi:hypothetical protein